MGFGMNYDTASGDIVPIIKYDAKAGRVFRIDRQDGQNYPVDITNNFKAVLDFENVEAGVINFDTGGAPDFVMVQLGQPIPPKPSDKHRQGIRMMLKLGKDVGGDVREIASVAKAALRGLDELHTAYEAGVKNNIGKLPVVALSKTIPITTGEGSRKSTNYQPVFEITGWVPRPADLVFKPRSKGGEASRSAQPAQPAQTGPASTGSTRVDPPAQEASRVQTQAPAREPVMADAEDFG